MKKSLRNITLSVFTFALVGLGLAFLGKQEAFTGALQNLMGVFSNNSWYFIVPPAGVALILMILLLVFKIVRRERSYFIVFSLLLLAAAYLVVAPLALGDLMNSIQNQVAPTSLLFTTGAALVVLALLVTIVIALLDVIFSGKGCARKVKDVVDEDEDDYDDEDEDDDVSDDEGEPLMPVVSEEVVEEKVEKKVEEKPVAKPAVKKAPAKDVDPDRIYHVMKRKKDDRWVVKIAQSAKAIRVLDTQKEAYAYAQELAKNNNGVVRVFASKGAQKGKIMK